MHDLIMSAFHGNIFTVSLPSESIPVIFLHADIKIWKTLKLHFSKLSFYHYSEFRSFQFSLLILDIAAEMAIFLKKLTCSIL